MEHLILLSEKCTSDDEETAIDEAKFVQYMRECPIWIYFKISHSNYVSKSHHEKVQLISKYYNAMSKGNKDIFVICSFCLFFLIWIKSEESLNLIFCLIKTFAE